MNIFVVTPYFSENQSVLLRCYSSVKNQNYKDLKHIFVADGNSSEYIDSLDDVIHIKLPARYNDTGASPRAIGALSAFAYGADAVAFLDADNTYQTNHINVMTSYMNSHAADVVTATRAICDKNGSLLYIDTIESNGLDFCDTNCYLIKRTCMHMMSYWIVDERQRLWSDRHFWHAIKNSTAKIVNSSTPTVNYHSKWAWHYQQAGVTIPSDAVWIEINNNALQHKQHQEYIRKASI